MTFQKDKKVFLFYPKLNKYICEIQTVLKVLLQFLYHEAVATEKVTSKSVCVSENIGKVIAACISDKSSEYFK